MRAGQKIDGRYEIIRHLGSGGMANVYLAYDPILERDVAIKFLRIHEGDSDDAVRRFQREALSISELNHPNIVSVFDIGNGEGDAGKFIVMEFVDGVDLKHYIKQNHPLSIETVRDIMMQILGGVQSAHESGIIHRDLKPQNIMIKPDGTVKIMDFGIAIVNTETSITQTNTIIGSVHYLSPEQARGSQATAQSDIYSLGIVLFEMLTGRVPFDGESAVSIALKHFQEPLPPIETYRDDVPMPMRNVIAKATAKEQADRYPSCAAMQEDLDTALDVSRLHEPPYVPKTVNSQTIVLAKEDIQQQLQYTDEASLLAAGNVTPPPAAVAKIEVPAAGAAEAEDLANNAGGPADEPVKSEDHSAVIAGAEAADPDRPNKGVKIAKTGSDKKKQKRRVLIIAAVILLMSLGTAIIYSMNRSKTFALPDVTEMTETEATLMLQQAGLTVGEVSEDYQDEVAAGLVYETDPEAGSQVKAEAEIDLKLSLGKEPVEIKKYVGMKFEAARSELERLGFEVERVDEYSDSIPADEVIAQNVAAGESVVPGENPIKLTVSKGQEEFEMRDLIGLNQTGIQQYADDAGLTVEFYWEHSDTVAEGLLLNQTIAPGSKFVRGDVLGVTLSLGPEKPKTVTFRYTVTIPYVEPDEAPSSSRSSSSGSSSVSSSSSGNSASNSSASSSISAALVPALWNRTATKFTHWWQDDNSLAYLTAGLPIQQITLEGENTQIVGLADILRRGENEIQVYIEDFNHDFDTPADTFTIKADRRYTMEFETEVGKTARFKIVRNGEIIMENRVAADDN